MDTKPMACAVAGVLALASACVTIKSTATSSETLLRRSTSVEVVPESLEFEATPSVRGESLAISVTSSETCRTSVTPVYRKTVHVENEIDPDAKNNIRPAYSFLAAAIFIGLGVLMYTGADSIASQPTQSGQKNSPDDIRTGGIVVGSIGIPLVAVGVVDLLRLRPEERVVGEVEHEPDVATASCHEHVIANQQLDLVAHGNVDWHATATSDDHGVTEFSVHDLPEAAFHASGDELGLVLHVGRHATEIIIDSTTTAQLLAAVADDPTSRVATDRAAAKAAADAKLAAASQVLATCQTAIDGGDLTMAIACWRSHASDWQTLGLHADDIAACLSRVEPVFAGLDACASGPEHTDDEILTKAACLSQFDTLPQKCGALDLGRLHGERATKLDITRLEKRVTSKSDAIIARQAKTAAEAAAKKQRCRGPSVIQVVVAIQIGIDVDASTLRDCSYGVNMGRVETTTRDGWMIVDWGSSLAAAFKSHKRHADGSYLQTKATARFTGLQVFERLDGGTATIPTFVLSE